jgi:hypothetical protein
MSASPDRLPAQLFHGPAKVARTCSGPLTSNDSASG